MLNLELPQGPVAGRALFVDMNSFFASIEQQERPELRGRPVGVCPFLNDATCVIAASVEAKRYGVVTGTRIPEARRLCPGITLLEDRAGIYRRYHRQIMDALDQTRCQVSVKSIDEAYLEVPADLRPGARQLADEVRQRVHQVGDQLGCSIGIAPNMFLAKMATKLQKPFGLVEVVPDELEGFYALLRLTDLYGISWRMERRLQAIGISSPLDLYQASHGLLKRSFGQPGEAWYLRLRGYEVDQRPTHRRMVGHQTTVVPDPAATIDEVLAVASQLAYRVALRLRRGGLMASSLAVQLRFTDRSRWIRLRRSRSPFNDSDQCFTLAEELIRSIRRLPHPVRLVSVTAFDLLPVAATSQAMFDPRDGSQRLSAALDELEDRYGQSVVMPARHLVTHPVADRVGFGNAQWSARELQATG